MDDDKRHQRHEAIAEAAYQLLAQNGYGGTSMLAIAKAARASNETLYRWYGDKDGLFKIMVRDNASQTRHMLQAAIADAADPRTTLARVGPIFLQMLLGEKAILLNRAAAADPSGALGAALSAGGRNEIMPLFAHLMQGLCAGTGTSPQQATEWFLGLLIGDLQIKRVIGDAVPISPEDATRRTRAALAALCRLID